ncbi:cytochrome D ubiquinol oxidase subunit I [Acidisoma cellulosilytica]|uniref:Cytochrome D ubiquinol oxidase subunit I n=1 Tax=Acidisoma cellulosilyticum TaxID=2802395 RepID=A0A964E5U6_9PROT|nr:pyridoxal-dependent decarboxylase [Acidisoma cellulosilyticum]MCB8882333.1 cytochrome D ubiquinol oxidase subunit I [Acidisoma cellulosilyticum]
MLDDMVDHLRDRRNQPVWQPLPPDLRDNFRQPLAVEGAAAEDVYDRFRQSILPYSTGNTHPRFMGWVHGGGTPLGMLAEMLAGGLNANLGGRDHAPIEAERQVIRWASTAFGLPETAGGLLVTGSSMANFIAVLMARRTALGQDSRRTGLGDARLTAYASTGVHRCVPDALDMAGIGSDALRQIPVGPDFGMDLDALRHAIAADRAAGFTPFLVIGTAGSVDIGAFDDLNAIADIAAIENLWFHVDGAFGALAALSPQLSPKVAGMERARSIAFDFHKWAQAPYDAGCILVRDQADQIATFASPAAYLTATDRGLSGNAPWPADLGPDLSRGFRALKLWFALQVFGADRLGAVAEQSCAVAGHLAARIAREPALELLAPVPLNIVCFRYRAAPADSLDALNATIVADVQEAGLAAPSTTTIGGHLAIRAAFVNHRSRAEDADALVDALLAAARAAVSQAV